MRAPTNDATNATATHDPDVPMEFTVVTAVVRGLSEKLYSLILGTNLATRFADSRVTNTQGQIFEACDEFVITPGATVLKPSPGSAMLDGSQARKS